ASGLVAFKLVAAFAIAATAAKESENLGSLSSIAGIFGEFGWVFMGSLVFGAIVGYLASYIIDILQGDRLVENTLILSLALGSFVIAEHFLGMSGAITTLIAGIILGNFGLPKISSEGKEFIHHFW